MIFFRNRVFARGALVVGLCMVSTYRVLVTENTDRLGRRACSPKAEYLIVLSLASLLMSLATYSSDMYSSEGIVPLTDRVGRFGTPKGDSVHIVASSIPRIFGLPDVLRNTDR